MSSSDPREGGYMGDVDGMNEQCAYYDQLRRLLENAIKEEDRVIAKLATERRYHVKKAETARRQAPQVD